MTIQDSVLQLTNCKMSKCKKEIKNKTIINEYLQKIRNIFDDYINKKITKQEFRNIKNELNNNYYKLIDVIAIHKCELAKCSKFVKKKLDYIAAKTGYGYDYIDKSKYTIDEYIDIIKLSTKITPDNPFDLIRCNTAFCNKENENNRNNSAKYLKILNKYYDDYINKTINQKVFKEKINKLVDEYYNSTEAKTLFTCELDKCSKLIKKKLDYIAIYINYDIKDKYTLDDYIKILTISEKIDLKRFQ